MGSFLRGIGRFVFGKVLPRTAYPVVTGPLKGVWFVLGSLAGDGGGATVYFNRLEFEQTEAMLRVLKPGMTFFDVGANVGYYSILASRIVGSSGTVAAFEPVVRNLAYLQRHIDLNRVENVHVLPFAVSNESGIVSFSTGSNSAMGHLDSDNAGDTLVSTAVLDEIAKRLDLKPDILKIDVEGAEVDVFRGASRILETVRPVIFLSTHSPALRKQCLELLGENGYECEQLIETDDPHEFVAYPNDIN